MEDSWVITSVAVLCLCYCNYAASATQLSGGSKCGFPYVQHLLDRSLRIVGGREAEYGSHPWLVSLKYRGSHFCGAAILTDRWILSAAHCFSTVSKQFLKNMRVTVGEHDQTVADAGEQTFTVRSIKVHEMYHHSTPMSYDIVLLELNGQIRFGRYVRPICLPLPSEAFPPGTTCVVSGWGRMKESGHLPSILHEVQLDLVEQSRCKYIIQTVRPGQRTFTVVCAGPESGGKDACQGDSGGPLVCPRGDGHWTLAGVTSWGKGCGRNWVNNKSKPPWKRGSPGIFTDVKMFLPWIKENIKEDAQSNRKLPSRLCGASEGSWTRTEGLIQNPDPPGRRYRNNEMCLWSIKVPAGKSILLEFLKFDLENDTLCNSDQLAVFAGKDRLIGRFCGDRHPSPILVGSSSTTLQFVSDFSVTGGGFSVKFSAVDLHSAHASGCGTVALLQSEGIVQSHRHPDLYGNNSNCRWVIHAPPGHVVKLAFNDFDVEPARECLYDSLTIFGDIEGKEELATLCGRTLPPPVLSYENVMMLQFTSDSSVSHRGFHANVSFISVRDLSPEEPVEPEGKFGAGILSHQITPDSCGMPHVSGRSALSRVLGGVEAAPHSWPWQVSLSLLSEHICGGAIIQPSWVLTAAHCLYGLEKNHSDSLMVAAGDHDLSARETEEQRRAVRRIRLHPRYDDSTLDYDIALLQLDAPLMFNKHISPVCLPSGRQEVLPSHTCTVSGWGSRPGGQLNRTLQQLEVPVLGQSVCEQCYPGRLTPNMMCAEFPLSEGRDTCVGDSGGPLVCQAEDSSYSVYGVTSWGQGCGKFQNPGVYASVPALKDWILQQLESTISENDTNESELRSNPQQADWILNEEDFVPEVSGAG